jgi:hypothetical protein
MEKNARIPSSSKIEALSAFQSDKDKGILTLRSSCLNNKSKGALKVEYKLEQLEHEFRAKVREYDINAKRTERQSKIEAIMAAKGKR